MQSDTNFKQRKKIPIQEIIPYISWTPYFNALGLNGRYPNRKYPNIFNDEVRERFIYRK